VCRVGGVLRRSFLLKMIEAPMKHHPPSLPPSNPFIWEKDRVASLTGAVSS